MAFAFTWKLINVNVKNYYLLQSNTVRIKFEFRGEKRWGCIMIYSICLFFQSCECLKMWTLLGAKGNPKGRGFPHHFEPLCFFVGTFIIIIINYVIYFFSKIYNCIDLIVHGQVCSFICCLWTISFLASTPYILLIHHQVVLMNLLLHCQPSVFRCFGFVPFFCQWGLFCFVFVFVFFLFPFLKSITMLSTFACSISNTIILLCWYM